MEKNKELGAVRVNSGDSGKGFHLLNESMLCELTNLGYELGPSLSNCYLAGASGLKLKRARSPATPTLSLEMARVPVTMPCWEGDGDLLEEQAMAALGGAHHQWLAMWVSP